MSWGDNGWVIATILYHNNVMLIYEYDTSVYCDWPAEIILSVYWEISCFSCYAAEFSAEICECYNYVCIIYMKIMHARMFESKIWSMCSTYNIFIHEYMSIWFMKEHKQTRWYPFTWRQLLDPSLWRQLNR